MGKGVPFRDAHAVVGNLVYYCGEHKICLEDLSLNELKDHSPLFEEDVYEALKLEVCMDQRSSYGGPALAETTRQINEVESFIASRLA